MQITVAGKDSTGQLSPRLVEQAGTRRPLQSRRLDDSALKLLESRNADEYVDHFYRLLRVRSSVDNSPWFLSSREGVVGRLSEGLKALLWRALRYQHERVTFQQNVINELLINALDFQQSVIRDDVVELKNRIEELHAEVAALRGQDGGGAAS